MRNRKAITVIEVLVVVALAAIILSIIYASSKGAPQDYQRDVWTGTETWTDGEGRKFMKSTDGSVRELSR